MDARLNETAKKDFNGEPSAIIKVVTTQTGFTFDCGSIGIVKTINKPSEIWVYVPHGAKRISIFHEKLGQIRDWMFTEPIEKSTVYELVLTTGKVITTVEETIENQWLVINTEPADASVYLNDLFVKSGTYQTKLKPGSYTYRVEAPLYHTEAGKVEITDTKKEITANLKPAFGFISVSSEPEKEAKVIIDGKALTTNTPCKTEGLASGEHTVQVIKEMYQPSTQKVTITDGQTTPVNFKLQPNFAELNITTSTEATLYVNNEQKATGNWNGRLNPGVYSLEARLDKHRPAKQDIELAAGDVKTVNLQPTPIYGSLDIISTPVGATISINGKDYGTTPNTVSKLLIGDYTIKLRKEGYANVSKITTILEGKSVEVNETLANGRSVTINSTSIGATLYIDGNACDITPYNGSLTFGNHTLSIEKDGKKAEKTVIITQTGGETNFSLSFVPETITDIDGNLYHTVTIGTQTWLVENLKVTRFRNGDIIPNIRDNTVWDALTTGAYCWYNNNADAYKSTLGALYNWYAVNTGKLAPIGWHVATDAEWATLESYISANLGASGSEAKALASKSDWVSDTGTIGDNLTPNNNSGFTALPGGYRYHNGPFDGIGISGYWWCYTKNDTKNGKYRHLHFLESYLIRMSGTKNYGFSVRCVRDLQ